jgi:phage terminase small subunit
MSRIEDPAAEKQAMLVRRPQPRLSLTPKQAQFAKKYVEKMGNGKQAAIDAGYSTRSAASIASENLRKPEVSAAIQAIRDKQQERRVVTADKVVQGIAHLGEDAWSNGNYAAALTAYRELAAILGLRARKSVSLEVQADADRVFDLMKRAARRRSEP